MKWKIPSQECLSDLSKEIKSPSVEEKLKTLSNFFPGKIVFSTSFNIEDQLISHFILSNKIPIKIFTLDTGRFFEETYKVWENTNKFYGYSISAYYPDQEKLEEFLSKNGPNSFYNNVKNRIKCCFLRKVEPLKRALKGNFVWITGLRAEHSLDRKKLNYLEWDSKYHLIKYHPLYNWKLEVIEKMVKKHKVPYNPLYDKGFLSIGCAPCTRSVKCGESYRSGRWWWEDDSIKKECGLHIKK
ncbi:phosphoadenylyl-sulfate reductase [Blattabacterium sp. (Blattella germanica)]|uniref:phosphoadenylyl-sulfate reductase n=1 Tax=Blattabacterium sp. (Blattella germanica) TaxID=624186 RepID=UPI0005A53187|nr:phosphoadenylyl-sulfate reductase [Blattabacterium sp. (Blattella germanica)]